MRPLARPEHTTEIVTAYASGQSPREIAERYGVSVATVVNRVRSSGGAVRPSSVTNTRVIDMLGRVIGKYTVLGRANRWPGKRKVAYWRCRCECGNIVVISGDRLRSHSASQMCVKCWRKEFANNAVTHGACRGRTLSKEYMIYQRARQRAKETGLAFDIEVSDIVVPDVCPVLGIALQRNQPHHPKDSSPSIDRIDSSKGYVKGNVWVISGRANRLKSDATIEELKSLVAALERVMAQGGDTCLPLET